MKIKSLIDRVDSLTNCKVLPPSCSPNIEKGHILPEDLNYFYNICGGIELFNDCDYGISIVPPNDYVLANPIILGEKAKYDISSNWYIIGRDANNDYLTIDLHKSRLGRCYDSNWEIHGVVGSCPIIAYTFTELLDNLIMSKGKSFYWLEEAFTPLGDAYD